MRPSTAIDRQIKKGKTTRNQKKIISLNEKFNASKMDRCTICKSTKHPEKRCDTVNCRHCGVRGHMQREFPELTRVDDIILRFKEDIAVHTAISPRSTRDMAHAARFLRTLPELEPTTEGSNHFSSVGNSLSSITANAKTSQYPSRTASRPQKRSFTLRPVALNSRENFQS